MIATTTALISFILAPGPAQAAEVAELSALAASIDAAASRAVTERFVPGGAVAVLEGGKVTLLRGYGIANSATGGPVTPSTIFQIGSISKTIAAWGIMRLVEEGRLDLDAPIGSVVKRWALPESDFDPEGVTIRRLLSHTAGLSVHGYAGFGPGVTLPTIEESLSGTVESSTAVRLVAEPGTEWSYSGGGYTLLQLAVEEISDVTFTEFMTSEVLAPLGMTSSRFGGPVESERFADAHGGYGEPADSPRFTALAAAGIHTTLEDMVRFAEASMTAKNAPLSEASIQAMQTPVSVGGETYGLGYQCGKVGEHRWIGHGGSNMVWLAEMRLVPETGDGILVFTNSSRGSQMLRDVMGEWSAAMGGERRSTERDRESAAAYIEPLIRAEGVGAAKRAYGELRSRERRRYNFSTAELIALGLHLVRTGDSDEGVEVLQWAAELKPKWYRISRFLGNTYEQLGKREQAVEAWRVAAAGGDVEATERLKALD